MESKFGFKGKGWHGEKLVVEKAGPSVKRVESASPGNSAISEDSSRHPSHKNSYLGWRALQLSYACDASEDSSVE